MIINGEVGALCTFPFATAAPRLRRKALSEMRDSEAQHRFGQRRGTAASNGRRMPRVPWHGDSGVVRRHRTPRRLRDFMGRSPSGGLHCFSVAFNHTVTGGGREIRV